MTEHSRIDRAAGCLVGLAIGDAFGDAARDPDNQFLYGITMDFPEKPTGSTDDTEFALLTAQILLNSKGDPSHDDVVAAWREHVLVEDELRRGGASEREAAANLRRGIQPPDSGRFNAYACSDGAAMRSAPAGIVAAGDPERASHLARIDAEISHDRDGIWGACSVAAAVAVAMDGGDADAIWQAAVEEAPPDSWLRHNFDAAEKLMNERDHDLRALWMPLHQILRSEYKAAVPEAVVSALAVFKLTHADFRETMIHAGNFGRDSDTVGAIVGALAGAMHGLPAIPADWVDKVKEPNGTCLAFTAKLDMLTMARKLVELG